MPRRVTHGVLAAVSLVAFATFLSGHGKGLVPGKTQGVPANLNTGFPGCGASQCHNPFPNFNVVVGMQAFASVQKGSTVPIKMSVRGANQTSTRGGFCLEATAGTFAAATNTAVSTTSTGRTTITHTGSLARSWSFSWKAPAKTGLVRMFGSANAANGDGRNSGDAWGWYGPDASLPGTPFRLFVNADKVTAFGTSCAGTKGFLPLIGMSQNAAVNQKFDVEVYNVPAGTASVGIFGLSNVTWGAIGLPLDLTALGAKGCSLRVSMDILAAAVTTGSGPGAGSTRHVWLIPNIAALRGVPVYLQELTIDPTANGLGMTFSMGLKATIQ